MRRRVSLHSGSQAEHGESAQVNSGQVAGQPADLVTAPSAGQTALRGPSRSVNWPQLLVSQLEPFLGPRLSLPVVPLSLRYPIMHAAAAAIDQSAVDRRPSPRPNGPDVKQDALRCGAMFDTHANSAMGGCHASALIC
jgi:hypothetical protein